MQPDRPPRDYRRAALVETCDEPSCGFCRLGARLMMTLHEADTDTSTEVLTLVRLLAATIVASTRHAGDRKDMTAAIVGQLHDDVAQLAAPRQKGIH